MWAYFDVLSPWRFKGWKGGASLVWQYYYLLYCSLTTVQTSIKVKAFPLAVFLSLSMETACSSKLAGRMAMYSCGLF